MYNTLNANWAGTLLGLIEVAIIPIPFIFYKYGGRIRQRSTLINTMQEDKKRLEQKRLRYANRGDDENNKLDSTPQVTTNAPARDEKDIV